MKVRYHFELKYKEEIGEAEGSVDFSAENDALMASQGDVLSTSCMLKTMTMELTGILVECDAHV